MRYFTLLFIFSFAINILFVEGIIGGKYAAPNQFKYYALVTMDKLPACGGAIISDRHVLSCAHCMVSSETNKFKEAKYTVQVGVIDLADRNDGRIERNVIKFYVPRQCKFVQFDEAVKTGYCEIGDISVLLLDIPLILGRNTKIVDLPSMTESQYVGQTAIISGFGAESLDECFTKLDTFILKVFNYMRIKLKYAEAKVISYEECLKMYVGTISDSHVICAQLIQHDVNKSEGCGVGDSGGPLVLGNTVIGILVNGPGDCNEQTSASVYTRVTYFLPFIYKAMRDDVSSDMRVATYERKRVFLTMKDVLVESKIRK